MSTATPAEESPDVWMTRKEVAALVECSMATVRRAEKDLRTRISMPLNQVLIHRDDAESWAELYTEQRAKRREVVPPPKKLAGLDALRLFAEGATPVDVALRLQILLPEVMAAWNEYRSAMQAHETNSADPTIGPAKSKRKKKSDRWWDVYCAVLPALIKDQPVHDTSSKRKRLLHKHAVEFANIAVAREPEDKP